ncbi:DUF4278 domain-containing protein [Oscillatoria sp. FACHB-1407]|uniref:DUF4278 domain-containing protein n=1 Tax=Oscillatoria sp. FACHB-1407 TaxID=2692847 RepID=UPI0016827D0D|nr:DUF4278 domain-containing protein [Oscillatoria sp. FACHB-1407]MBD2464396.1 DUF4278 domain-containing protein [Oscillatoria sp. FACHB-1407]
MQLSYRGIPYQSEAHAPQISEGEVVGKYRGLPAQIGSSDIVPNQVSTLRYRGVFYLRGR